MDNLKVNHKLLFADLAILYQLRINSLMVVIYII